MTKMNDIKKMKDADIATFINEKREAVRAAGFGMGGKNTAAVRVARQDIARALTELNSRAVETGIAKTETE